MHCDWFVHWQVQRLQAVPTLPLALVKLLRLPRKHKLLQLVRSLQHCGTCQCVHVNVCVCVHACVRASMYVVSTSVRLACYTVCSFVGLTGATEFQVPDFLKKYETEFFEVVNPRLSLLRLVRKGVITEGVKSDINTSNTKDARQVLYHYLANHANVDNLKEYCEVAIDAEGYPKMQSFGRKMMKELEQRGWSELCAYLCVWGMCVCVCVCV